MKYFYCSSRIQKKYEKQAIAAYILVATKKQNGLKITPAGLTFSPDSILECVCCGKGVLEVKCPYHLKDCCLDEVETLSNFCLTKNCEVTLVLKQI